MDNEEVQKQVNTTDAYYKSLECELEPVSKTDEDYKTVSEYLWKCFVLIFCSECFFFQIVKLINNSKSQSFCTKLTPQKIFRVNKPMTAKRFKKDLGNRLVQISSISITLPKFL